MIEKLERLITQQIDNIGGASRDRTDDPLLAKQVLSQLSYGPNEMGASCYLSKPLVGLGGLEPPTSPLSGVRSNQLSYRPSMTRFTRILCVVFRRQLV